MANFVRHFRIYFKNNHPAYIVDEEGNKYVFHRVTHSKTSGGRNNWKIVPNPLSNSTEPMFIVKKEQKDKKNRFSPYQLKLKKGANVSNLGIKKAGSTQTLSRETNATGTTIKPKNKKKGKQKARRTQAIHDSNHGRATLTSSTTIKPNRKGKGK